MKRAIFLVGFLLAGCVVLPNDGLGGAGGSMPATEGIQSPGQPDAPDHGPGICGSGTLVEEVVINGVVQYVEIPVMCDPYAKDSIDPPPERHGQTTLDRPQETQGYVINVQ